MISMITQDALVSLNSVWLQQGIQIVSSSRARAHVNGCIPSVNVKLKNEGQLDLFILCCMV